MGVSSAEWRAVEEIAGRAEILAYRRGPSDESRQLYRQAAEMSGGFVERIGTHLPRTRSIVAVNTVALFYRAQEWAKVVEYADRYLAVDLLPFAVDQLTELRDEARQQLPAVAAEKDNTP